MSEYRFSHQDAGHGTRYERMYGLGYFRQLWQDVERPLVVEVLEAAADASGRDLLVDLACGTGRVSVAATEVFDRVVGLDVSEEMLEIARSARDEHPNATFLLRDVQQDGTVDEVVAEVGRASCVTAFRLFTNADEVLRRDAAACAYGLLADGGRLVVNTHMVPQSPVGALYRAEHWVRARLGREQRMFNKVLAAEELCQILRDAGFREVRVRRYAALPGVPKLWKHFRSGWALRAERRLGGRPWNQCALVTAVK
jgi:ubiquinone/menaquinone biosynthesis C-methylase UbiE